MPSTSAIWLPSRSGRTAASSSWACSRAIRTSSSSYVRGQPLGLALVAGGAVRAGQLVQPRQQRSGVGDVAAHGRVGPLAVAVAVEAQVQLDQPGDRLDRVLVEAQRLEPLGRQLGADHLVVVEADAAAVLEPAGRRLADVVQQRGQPQHEVGPGHRVRPGRPAAPPARSPAPARSASARRRPCAGGARRSPARSAGSSGSTCSARPVSTSSAQPARGIGAPAAASPARPGPARPRRWRSARPSRSSPRRPRGPRANPSWETNRAARIIRSGSSANDSCGVPGVRSTPRGRSVRPSYGSTKLSDGSRRPSR